MAQQIPIDNEQLEQIILKQLPTLVEQSPKIQKLVADLAEHRRETKDWVYQILEELRQDRQQQAQKWEEQNQKWEEQNQKWEEAKRQFDRQHEEIKRIADKHDQTIGALGARWGIQAESSFRNALAAILEKNFGVQVLNINEWDEEGIVFGRPDQVELDVIIKNSLLIICEIKSSIDKAGMYMFERKVRFYEKRHQQTAQRMIVISPMVDPRAKPVAEKLGIEVYSHSWDVNP